MTSINKKPDHSTLHGPVPSAPVGSLQKSSKKGSFRKRRSTQKSHSTQSTSLVKEGLYFLPLGGSDEIGMNFNLYACDGKWLMVDLGISFADEPGIDVVVPDITFIKDKLKDVVGLVLTHAHEDHIGAIPHLWHLLQCPMYATPFTAAIIRNKLAETPHKNAPIIEVPLGGRINLKPFDIEFVTLTHSIPEPNALAIRTKYGTIMHTGDWKIDPDPLVGDATNASRLEAIGKEGVLALVCDSTNVFQKGSAGSEGTVRERLIEIIQRYPRQRVTMACFASNVARMETAAKAAMETGRTIVTIGRSLEKMEAAARYAGYLKGVPKFQHDGVLKDLAPENTLILCTGSQGESRSALARIAAGTHPIVRLGAGDVVIFSAKTIPGNERSVGLVQNTLTRAGATIITAAKEPIHVSGHPHRDELAQMYAWTKPRIIIPVHGEAMHLYEHKRFATEECHVPQGVIPSNGTLIRLDKAQPEVVSETLPSGYHLLDGKRLIERSSPILRDRERLGAQGCVFMTLKMSPKGRLGELHMTAYGISEPGADTEKLKEQLQSVVSRALKSEKLEGRKLTQRIEQEVKRHCSVSFGKKPVVDTHILKG